MSPALLATQATSPFRRAERPLATVSAAKKVCLMWSGRMIGRQRPRVDYLPGNGPTLRVAGRSWLQRIRSRPAGGEWRALRRWEPPSVRRSLESRRPRAPSWSLRLWASSPGVAIVAALHAPRRLNELGANCADGSDERLDRCALKKNIPGPRTAKLTGARSSKVEKRLPTGRNFLVGWL